MHHGITVFNLINKDKNESFLVLPTGYLKKDHNPLEMSKNNRIFALGNSMSSHTHQKDIIKKQPICTTRNTGYILPTARKEH